MKITFIFSCSGMFRHVPACSDMFRNVPCSGFYRSPIKLPKSAILVSMDVTNLYKNITQREGIITVCHAYEEFHQGNPPVPTRFLSEMLSLILLENSFQFNEKDHLPTHGTAMGTKMALAFANIFMAKIEKEILRQSSIKPIFWKRFIDDIISVWDTSRNEIEEFLLQANNFHPTIKFTAEISETETTFLDTKGTKVSDSTLDVRAHFKPTETFQYTKFVFVSPTRRHKRLHQRRSFKASKNKFLLKHF